MTEPHPTAGPPKGSHPESSSPPRPREAVITALHLIRAFAGEAPERLVSRFLYDSDVEVSRAAIRAASLPGNTGVLGSLFELIERSPLPIKIEAVGALAEIGDPQCVSSLVKYFALFKETDLRCRILETINVLSPSHGSVSELNHGVLMDEKHESPLKERAARGLVRSGDFAFLSHYVLHAPPEVQEAVFSEIVCGKGAEECGRAAGREREGDRAQASRFLKRLEEHTELLSPRALGLYLCAYFLKVRNPQNSLIIEHLAKARAETHAVFFRTLIDMVERAASVKRIFRLILLAPHKDEETERLVDELLERLIEFTGERSPQAMSELMTLSVVYLENLYNKIKKDHLSLKGVKGRFDLLVVLFARLLERLAEKPRLAEVTAFFKDEKPKPSGHLIERIKSLLGTAGEGDRKRFEACIPLFSETERLRRQSIYSALRNIQPETPNLVKRFHRVIRAAGILKVRAVSKRIWEVLRFAQEERLHDLEAESILALCRIGSKNVLLELRNRLNDPESAPEVKTALVRGARYLPPADVVDVLVAQLFVPEGAGVSRLAVLETMREMNLAGFAEVPGALLKLFAMNVTEAEKEIASALLERHADAQLFQSLVALSGGRHPADKRCAIRALASLARREKGVPVDVLTHRLYLLLRDPDESVRIESLFALVDLNDDYAQKILKEWLAGERDGVRAAIIRRLARPFPNDLLLLLIELMASESAELHRVLREVLPAACRSRACEEVQKAVFSHLEAERGPKGLEPKTAPRREERKESIIHQPKIEFKFRMEHSQVLTVFFIDVVDYTARATRVDMSSLMQFVKTFEDTVIPLVEEYNGRVVKKLGDGILAAFLHPAAAGLASLAIQQEVRDHNRFAVEEDRFSARIGLHTGSVIRKEGDIFGDVVNIASRMQQAAQPGMVLMTEATHREVKDLFVCRSLGRIKVKGVSEGVVAYALEGARPEVAELLEGRRGEGAGGGGRGVPIRETPAGGRASGRDGKEAFLRLEESLFTPAFRIPREGVSAREQKEGPPSREPAVRESAAREILPVLRGMFQDILKALEEIAGDYHEEYIFKAYLQSKWEEILQKLNGRG